jgi:hypothetical protein
MSRDRSRDSDLRVLLRLRGTARRHHLDGCLRPAGAGVAQPLDLPTLRAGWQLSQHVHR